MPISSGGPGPGFDPPDTSIDAREPGWVKPRHARPHATFGDEPSGWCGCADCDPHPDCSCPPCREAREPQPDAEVAEVLAPVRAVREHFQTQHDECMRWLREGLADEYPGHRERVGDGAGEYAVVAKMLDRAIREAGDLLAEREARAERKGAADAGHHWFSGRCAYCGEPKPAPLPPCRARRIREGK